MCIGKELVCALFDYKSSLATGETAVPDLGFKKDDVMEVIEK